MRLSSDTRSDLARSGLTDATVQLAQIEDPESNPLMGQVLAKHKIVAGYRIPYFNLQGQKNGYWRIKNLSATTDNKYLGPKKQPPHLYVPPGGLMPKGWHKDPSYPLIVTEGEKKALAAAQHGFPTVGLSGIWSWRRTILSLKKEKVQSADDDTLVVDISDIGKPESKVIEEFGEIVWKGRDVTIIFDSDAATNPDIRSAAFELALELVQRGASVLQFRIDRCLTGDARAGKVGLDDFLLGPEGRALLETPPDDALVLPVPDDPRTWITDQLNSKVLPREGQERVANVALSVLDNQGSRYRDPSDTFYYFEDSTKILHPFDVSQPAQLRTSSFGGLLVQDLGIKTHDSAIMSRLLDEYTTRSPLETIIPRRAVAAFADPDRLYYQIGDGRTIRVSSRGFKFLDNGDDSVLFIPGTTQSIDEDLLKRELRKRPGEIPLWFDALQTVNLQPLAPLTLTETQILLTCLFYMSPWLNRWRGLQLPMEVAVAEPNSGKTFLYNLRRGVLTGNPALEGLPDDFRGWVSAVTAAPGIWVCDNLGTVRSDYWHRLNDELARLITDPNPSIELRKLYTTSAVSRIPVHSTFAITTIKNPFSAPDILQRSLVFSLHAIPADHRKSTWYTEKMASRTRWLAEHLQVIHRFFKEVEQTWSDEWLSGFRLVHFDQALVHMGRALGWESQVRRIVKLLPSVVAEAVAEYDPVVECLKAFVTEFEAPMASPSDVVRWVQEDPDERYVKIKTFSNSILLGRYIKSHEYDVEQSTGMKVLRRHNQTVLQMPLLQETPE